MTYGPIQGGPYGACQEVYPKPLEDDGLCDCGLPKTPNDFLCHKCRAALERYQRQVAEEMRDYDRMLFPGDDPEEEID